MQKLQVSYKSKNVEGKGKKWREASVETTPLSAKYSPMLCWRNQLGSARQTSTKQEHLLDVSPYCARDENCIHQEENGHRHSNPRLV